MSSSRGVLSAEQYAVFESAINAYVSGLRNNFRSLVIAQPEDQLKAPVGELVKAAGLAVSMSVLYRTEVKVDGVAGRPDLGIDVDQLPAGNVELKAPGKGANPGRFTDKRSRDQWERFKALPNLLYTDGTHWALYRNGELSSEAVNLGVPVDADGPKPDDTAIQALARLLIDFLGWSPVVPSTPKGLAQMLAPVTRLLRDEVLADIAGGGILKSLADEWRASLFPDADDRQFADGYAQTFTYALLLARLEGAEPPLRSDSAATELDADHALLAQALRVLGQQGVRDAISMPVELLERLIGAVDGKRLTKNRDPWLYFYEDFLAAYDADQRNNRGVYYTPIEVVQYQVRSLDALLRERLGKSEGVGSQDLLLLDPAAGTGTYPLSVVDKALEDATELGGPGYAAEVATRLASNINAFEILVGPYAVTHLRLSRALRDGGATLPGDGARVFLTDSLAEPALEGFAKQINVFQRKLAEEQERASVVKSTATRVTAIIGNPPWDRDSSGFDSPGRRKGGMVRYSDEGQGLLRTFIEPLTQAARAQHSYQLYNDYVYFWRWALWKSCEQQPGPAIVSFITASAFLDGEGFGGMRRAMREAFDEIWLVDLGGEGRGSRKEDNVFDGVMTPNVITIGLRQGEVSTDSPATVRYRRVSGSKTEKLDWLTSQGALDAESAWDLSPSDWDASFLPTGGDSYARWPSLADVFPWSARGTQYSRSWPVAESREVAERRWSTLVNAGNEEQRTLLHESRDSQIQKSYKSFLTGHQLPPLSSLAGGASPDGIERVSFRSFDVQWAVADRRVIDMPRPPLWAVAGQSQIFFSSVEKATTNGPALVPHPHVPDLNATNNRGGTVYPLYRDREGTNANISSGLLETLAEAIGRPVSGEEVGAYVYGVTGTSAFTREFAAQIGVSGLHVPLTTDVSAWEAAVDFGRKLIRAATAGARELGPGKLDLAPSIAKCTVSPQPSGAAYPEEFSYDASAQVVSVGSGRFEPVAPAVWSYEVSGMPVLSSWLGYRMRKRAGKSSSPLDRQRPINWTFTGELLQVIGIIERLVAAESEAISLIERIMATELLAAGQVGAPTAQERSAPSTSATSDSVTLY